MAMNVPLFVVWNDYKGRINHRDKSSVPYFIPGLSGEVSSIDNFQPKFAQFLHRFERNFYLPRRFVVEMFNYFDNVVDFMTLLCTKQNRFNPLSNFEMELTRVTNIYDGTY